MNSIVFAFLTFLIIIKKLNLEKNLTQILSLSLEKKLEI